MQTFTISEEQRQDWLDALLNAYQILETTSDPRVDEAKEVLDRLMVEVEDLDPQVKAEKENINAVMFEDTLLDLSSKNRDGQPRS